MLKRRSTTSYLLPVLHRDCLPWFNTGFNFPILAIRLSLSKNKSKKTQKRKSKILSLLFLCRTSTVYYHKQAVVSHWLSPTVDVVVLESKRKDTKYDSTISGTWYFLYFLFLPHPHLYYPHRIWRGRAFQPLHLYHTLQ